jgi:hypothetical protein
VNSDLILRRALAVVAFSIAIAAIVDPEIASQRASKPDVRLVVNDAQDAAIASDVEKALSKRFTVSREPIASANGTVVIGEHLAPSENEVSAPVFAVTPSGSSPRITLERTVAPAKAAIDAQTPVQVTARVTGARGREADIELKSGGLTVDRIRRTIGSDDERIQASLPYVPISVGAVPLRVHASINGSSATSMADVAIDAVEKRWPVLFFDPRPSWMSTFVRRALERDPRFVVTSRTMTSRTLSTDAGTPPRIDDLAALSLYDAIVVGSPEALSSSDVSALDAFLRRRGGGVALLLDTRATGPYERVIGSPTWNTASPAKPESIATRAGPTLRAGELAWPAQLPLSAQSLVTGPRPIVWQTPLGIGTIVVSGALDSWRYRDSASSGFERFWQQRVASLAENAVPAVSLTATRAVVRPGDDVELFAMMRDTTARPAADSLRYVNLGGGLFGATLRAPMKPGTYRFSAAVNADRAELPLVVSTDATPAQPSALDLVASWARSHGGDSFSASNLEQLESSMRSAISAAPRLVLWHPMRAPWWIVPFALALSGEWWLRRRRGLR